MTAYERSDIIHIMKMNRLLLIDSDTAQLEFGGQVREKDYRITILVVEDLPQVSIKQNGKEIYSDTLESIDDLKIFLEERLYKFLEGWFLFVFKNNEFEISVLYFRLDSKSLVWELLILRYLFFII